MATAAALLQATLQPSQHCARALFASQQLCQQRYLHWGSNSSSTDTTASNIVGSDAARAISSGELCDSTAVNVVSAAVDTALPDLGFFAAGAQALDALHAATGLPWCAVIPAAAVAIKTVLLPISLKQAKIVRTNMVLWKEAYEFQQQQHARQERQQQEAVQQQQYHLHQRLQQQQQQQQQQGQQGELKQQQQEQPQHQHQQQQQPAVAPAAQVNAAASALQQLHEWQERLSLFHDLRRKCGVPHPAWLVVNGSLQVPIFVYTAASIRRMAQANWPGFSSEGALWFSDLTQPALFLSEAAGVQLPLGLPGLILPCAATAVMLTSIHLGFKASGAAAKHPSLSGTWLSSLLLWLRPFLYAITLVSAGIKVQLPQAPVLHWFTTASYTLGLQLGLRSPKVRQLLGFSQPGSVDSSKDVDPAVVAQAAAMDNPDVLVVMGAKHAALQRYNEAMHCLTRALQLNPSNARAHYSAGQIYALQNHWAQSEQSYRTCAQLTPDLASQAQALYCVGVACHQQGNYPAALDAYKSATAAGPANSLRPMLVLGTARALQQMGQADEAAAVAQEGLLSDGAGRCPPPVAQALRELAGQQHSGKAAGS